MTPIEHWIAMNKILVSVNVVVIITIFIEPHVHHHPAEKQKQKKRKLDQKKVKTIFFHSSPLIFKTFP